MSTGYKLRYFSASALIETLYRGLADNSVGKVIDQVLRADLILVDQIGFAPMDDTGAQLFFRLIAAAYEHRALGVASHWPFEEGGGSCPNTTRPSACLTDSSTTVSLSSPAASRSR